MADNYNPVYTIGDAKEKYEDALKEIAVEQVYLTIPTEWVCIYHKLLHYMADFGKTLIDDCSTMCKGRSKNIITCWNLFQSAIAAHALGQYKQADFFINYIKQQLELIYKGADIEVFSKSVPLAITDDGRLKAIVSCGNETKFEVDTKTGDLYQLYLDAKQDGRDYVIDDEHLGADNINNPSTGKE